MADVQNLDGNVRILRIAARRRRCTGTEIAGTAYALLIKIHGFEV
jgi:hypothetical protein